MIYKISQISNLATALLYPYRIVRTASNMLNELLRYSEQFTAQLVSPVVNNGVFEYNVEIGLNPNKIPFIEFINPNLIPELASLYEAETTEDKLILRTTQALSKPVDIAVYEVYSLQYIAELLAKYGAELDNNSTTLDDAESDAGNIKIQGKWIIADNVRVPNLVMIDKADDGLVYGDSDYMLSGSLSSQQLINPTQKALETMIKCLTNQLTIKIVDKLNRVIQGFYNGLLTIDSNAETLVIKNCNAIIQLNKLNCKTLIIDNCPFVFIKSEPCEIDTVEIRHSTVTIDTDITIKRIMLSRMSTVNQIKCKLETLLLLEAGSTYYVSELNDDNAIEHVEAKAIQGQFCISDKPVYLHHQNVSFQRGQVEDPLPISELKVDITISGGVTPTPGDVEVDTRFTPSNFIEYVTRDISDTYMGTLPTVDNIEQNIGLGIMYGICLSEYGDNPVGWLYARIFRTYLMLGYYKVFSHNLTDEGRALLDPETGIWSFGTLYSESGLLAKVHADGSDTGLNNFYNMIKYGGKMTGYSSDMDDYDKMRIIAGGTPTGNNSETGCPQDGQFHENWYAAGIVDARWIYDSPSPWIPYGTGRMTYYADQRSAQGGTINPNI